MQDNIRGTVKVSVRTWNKYRRRKETLKALAEWVAAQEQKMGLPEASESNAGKWLVAHSETGELIGKVSVFSHPGCVVPPHYKRRIS